ncbi:hypothetical protein G6F65_019796 [Rhizopus arrhizus]|nr:hypothetical protein G6F65_019796 [Rhizopus arrhizus]
MIQAGRNPSHIARRGVVVVDDGACHGQRRRVQEIGAEIAGFDDGRVDAQRLEFRVQRFGQPFDRELGRAVRAEPRAGPVAAQRRQVDHVAGTLRPQRGQHGARHVQQAEHVGVVHAAHVGIAGLFNGAQQAEARIVHQHVDTAESRQAGGDGRLGLGFVGVLRWRRHCGRRR